MNRFILFATCLWAALATTPASALTPPVGWTIADSSRAVLDPASPEKGEGPGRSSRWRSQRACLKKEELVAALMKEGVAIERFGIEPNGHINLVGPERLGRARLYWEAPGVARWWAVLASQSTS